MRRHYKDKEDGEGLCDRSHDKSVSAEFCNVMTVLVNANTN